MAVIYHQTPIGFARIEDDGNKICSVTVLEHTGTDSTTPTALVQLAANQLDEYFKGERKAFDFPYQQTGTDFQQQVWQNLCNVNYAETISYAQLSKRMKNPLAIRAIAAANGKNNLWIVVPCHRIIGSDGSLTGYAGGLWRKQWLLDFEAKNAGVGQTTLF